MAMTSWSDDCVAHHEVDVGSVRLHYVEAGTGPLVILLHGFPEFWYSWRFQIPALAAAGFRAVAVDMRGYNLSSKPPLVSDYIGSTLADDVAGLIRALGAEKAHVVGHDWGAAVAWLFAMRHPQLLDRLTILNVPHPVRFGRGLRTFKQLRKSWYIFFFQIPWAPEAMFRSRGWRSLWSVFKKDPLRAGAFTDDDIRRYIFAMSRPGGLTAAINYYRAAFRYGAKMKFAPIEAAVLVLWGERDRYIGLELAEPDRKWAPNCKIVRFPNASHWVQVDEPEGVNQALIAHLTEMNT